MACPRCPLGLGRLGPLPKPVSRPPRASLGIPCPILFGGLTLLVCLAPLLGLPFAGLLLLPPPSALLLELGGMLLLRRGALFHT